MAATFWFDGQWTDEAPRLIADNRHHKMALLIGPPRSGKGTTLAVLSGANAVTLALPSHPTPGRIPISLP